MDQKLDLKTRIFLSGLTRKILAARLGISYNAFCHRLSGFANFSSSQEFQLNKILSDAEQVREAESNQESNLSYFQK
jgi:hypothetical protein